MSKTDKPLHAAGPVGDRLVLQHAAADQTHDVAALAAMAKEAQATMAPDVHVVLRADADGLSLFDPADPRAAPTRIDFLDSTLQYRLRTSGKRQGIGKAVGLDKIESGRQLFVVDATAGLGRDALVLAHLGCRVQLLERSPLLHALLADGFRRGLEAAEGEMQEVLQRMTLRKAEAREWLLAAARGEEERPDVVYLDPMFPPRDKSAKVKKDIALLHQLLGSEEDAASLLDAALKAAKHRVVLKRPDGRVPESLPQPTLWIGERPAAFAVYVNSSFARIS